MPFFQKVGSKITSPFFPHHSKIETVELESITNKSKIAKIKISDKINKFIKENFAEDIKYFEKKNKVKVEIISDNSLIVPDHIIEFQNKSKKVIKKIESLTTLKKVELSEKNISNIKTINKNRKYKKRKFYKKKFYKKNN